MGGGVLNRLDKNYPLFIHKLGYKFFACLATLVFILSTALLIFPQKYSKIENPIALTYGSNENPLVVGYDSDSNSFNKDDVNKLLQMISGESSVSTDNLSALESKLSSGPLNSENMRGFSVGKEAGEDIYINLFGQKWTAVYLSSGTDSDIILTLWSKETSQIDSLEEYAQWKETFGALANNVTFVQYLLDNINPWEDSGSGDPSYANYIDKSDGHLFWLPSILQAIDDHTLYNEPWNGGIWRTSVEQCKNDNLESLGDDGFYTWTSDVMSDYNMYIYVNDENKRFYYGHKGAGSAVTRPAFNLNLTEVAKNVSSEVQSDKFHIYTAKQFLSLAGETFDPSETYYLEQDITIDASAGLYTPIGSDDNPFTCTFDGQYHTLNFNFISDQYVFMSIFGTIADSTFCNLNINYDVNITGDHSRFCGLCKDQKENTTCNLSHINIFGEIVAPNEVTALGMFGFISHSQCFQNLYDVNIYLTSAETAAFIFAILGNCEINSCSFICPNIMASQILIINFEGECKISNSQFDVCSANSSICGMVTPYNRTRTGNLTIVESSFNIKLDAAMESTLGLDGAVQKVTLLDVAINCSSFTNIITKIDDGSGTNYPEGYYYSGVYIHDPKANDGVGKTTIINSDFTSSKWCMDPHYNNGLPQLRRFVSIGDFMEQCDMASWVERMKNEK